MNEEELRARFSVLRAADEHHAPGFRGVVDRPGRAMRPKAGNRRWLLRMAISLAAAAVIVVAVGIARASRRPAFVAPPLSTWTSPTAGLLRMPAIDHPRPSSVMSTYVEIAASAAQPQRGQYK